MVSKNSLALYGGTPVRQKPLAVMHPGATLFDEAEVKAAQEQSALVNNEKHDVLYVQRC